MNYKKRNNVLVSCANCGTKISRPPSKIELNTFCSQTCAASLNNKIFPKRKKVVKLCQCGQIISKYAKKCKTCHYKSRSTDSNMGHKMLSECCSKYGQHKYQSVRNHARWVAKQLGLKKVCFCGYKNHVELCHLKPICDFSLQSTFSQINAATNLVFLCPNHHWELDNGFLDINNIQDCQQDILSNHF